MDRGNTHEGTGLSGHRGCGYRFPELKEGENRLELRYFGYGLCFSVKFGERQVSLGLQHLLFFLIPHVSLHDLIVDIYSLFIFFLNHFIYCVFPYI